jgi:hypothetical protein
MLAGYKFLLESKEAVTTITASSLYKKNDISGSPLYFLRIALRHSDATP